MVKEMLLNSIIPAFSYSMQKQESLPAYLSGNSNEGECVKFKYFCFTSIPRWWNLVLDLVRLFSLRAWWEASDIDVLAIICPIRSMSSAARSSSKQLFRHCLMCSREKALEQGFPWNWEQQQVLVQNIATFKSSALCISSRSSEQCTVKNLTSPIAILPGRLGVCSCDCTLESVCPIYHSLVQSLFT